MDSNLLHLLANFYGCFCHRQPDRSFSSECLFCARCSGLYIAAFGFATSAALLRRWRISASVNRVTILLLLSVLTPTEVLLEAIGFQGSNVLRYWLASLTCIGILGLCRLDHNAATAFNHRSHWGLVFLSIGVTGILGMLTPPMLLWGSRIAWGISDVVVGIGFFMFFGNLAVTAVGLLSNDPHPFAKETRYGTR